MEIVKNIIRKALKNCGLEIRNLQVGPAGRMDVQLKNLRSKGLECHWILDIGANKATWSRMAKKMFPSARFFLIEPQREMQPHLQAFTTDFPDSTFILAGAGPTKTKQTLTIWEDLAGSSFLPKEIEAFKISGKQREVDMVTIDGLIRDQIIKVPTLIKLDIQGFELEALKGATLTFGQTEVFLLETSFFSFDDLPNAPEFAEVVQFMAERDYVVYDFPGFLRRPYDGALGQCDICFVKRTGFLRKSNRWK